MTQEYLSTGLHKASRSTSKSFHFVELVFKGRACIQGIPKYHIGLGFHLLQIDAMTLIKDFVSKMSTAVQLCFRCHWGHKWGWQLTSEDGSWFLLETFVQSKQNYCFIFTFKITQIINSLWKYKKNVVVFFLNCFTGQLFSSLQLLHCTGEPVQK